jgi:hypothetical protein
MTATRSVWCLGVWFALQASLLAGTTWDGGGADASWGTATNWNLDTLPLFNGTETLSFGTAFGSGLSMTLDGSRSIAALIQSTASSITFGSGTPSGSVLTLGAGNITMTGSAGNQTHNEDIVLGQAGSSP